MNSPAAAATLCLLLFSQAPSQDSGNHTQLLAEDHGIQFMASTSVSNAAVERAQYVAKAMLSNVPEVRAKMAAAGFKVEIIGKDQVLSDLPDYADLRDKKTFDGRSFDSGTRGVGARRTVSIGEENLLCLPVQKYRQEDIFVHEFSHSIKSNMSPELSGAIDAAYRNAVAKDLYPSNIYMMANSQEYWAEATQVWFAATVRSDVNGGFNTRDKLKAHDPDLAAVLERVYGPAQVARASGCAY